MPPYSTICAGTYDFLDLEMALICMGHNNAKETQGAGVAWETRRKPIRGHLTLGMDRNIQHDLGGIGNMGDAYTFKNPI